MKSGVISVRLNMVKRQEEVRVSCRESEWFRRDEWYLEK